MARSRHGRTGGGSSPGGSGLPSWAQRHLDEAGDPALEAAAPVTRRHQRRAAPEPSGLRGWGVAIVSVAAAVGAVPLAISSLANDHSDDPLPRVDTYTAGSPGPLQAEGGAPGAGRTRAPGVVPAPVGGDPASAGVLDAPPAAPAGGAPAAAAPALAAPVPAAVVRPTPRVLPPAATTTKTTTPATTEGQGRSATKPPKPSPPKPSKPSNPKPPPSGGGGSDDGGDSGGGNGGLLGNTVGGLTHTVGGVARTATGLLGG